MRLYQKLPDVKIKIFIAVKAKQAGKCLYGKNKV
jgi:hypothetical protein